MWSRFGKAGQPIRPFDATQVTHPDVWQRWLEIETIKRLLWREAVVIDVGCGNGFATKQLAPLVKSIVGVDQSDGMIRRAKEEGALPSNATFAVADVLDLSPAQVGTFDVALTIRCLINLPDWQMQQGALANIAGILKPGGSTSSSRACARVARRSDRADADLVGTGSLSQARAQRLEGIEYGGYFLDIG
jgi:SAM-dependent methyltransferase